jgi:hypothetical protein
MAAGTLTPDVALLVSSGACANNGAVEPVSAAENVGNGLCQRSSGKPNRFTVKRLELNESNGLKNRTCNAALLRLWATSVCADALLARKTNGNEHIRPIRSLCLFIDPHFLKVFPASESQIPGYSIQVFSNTVTSLLPDPSGRTNLATAKIANMAGTPLSSPADS